MSGKQFERRTLKIAEINWKGGTQARSEMNKTVVAKYAYQMKLGAEFPPIVVFWDGNVYWPGDGFHRAAANRLNGNEEVLCEVRLGGQREAYLHGVVANAKHGSGLTTEDYRRALIWLLSADKPWADSQTDRALAKMVQLDHKTVASWRRKVNSRLELEAQLTAPPASKPTGGVPKRVTSVR